MQEIKFKVYIQTDGQGRVVRCEGGCTTPEDLTGWTYIDEGAGDRYNLCQAHYFDGGLYTTDAIPRYKLVEGKPVLRTDEEIEADRKARPEPDKPVTVAELSQENKMLRAQIRAQGERSDFIEDCIAEMAMQVYNG